MLRNATNAQLEAAAAFNHTALFALNALSVKGRVFNTLGVAWTDGGVSIESMIAFPVLDPEIADIVLDEILQYFIEQPPAGIGCWSLDPPTPVDLGARLLARGFQPGWHPNWMSLELARLQQDHPFPGGLEVTADNSSQLADVPGLPYGNADIRIFSNQPPGQSVLQRFVARLNDEVVAQCSVLLTDGEHAVAGIYHVGVVPKARNRGIAKAVVAAACHFAGARGYHYALLNGTGYRMYEQLGFKRLGKGHTWWLQAPKLLAHPPQKHEIILAQAIARGDLATLRQLGSSVTATQLGNPITNGMTLMQLAVHCRQPASADWLLSLGLSMNVIEAWDLGRTQLAATILQENPAEVNKPIGEGGLTLLHIAVERGDLLLAELAMKANADPAVKDRQYHSTPLDWARHLENARLADLLGTYATSYSNKI